ncbi:hypothetical protein BSKO_13233 [Bryopsis sp. KO-2023]|nr:hypothetical protein BSKO_13233 [Bryopsis sp. KO-2023]
MPVDAPPRIQAAQSISQKEGDGRSKGCKTAAIMVTSTPVAQPLAERGNTQVESAPVETVPEVTVRKRTFGLGASLNLNEGNDNDDTAVSKQSLGRRETEPETISVERLKQMSGSWLQDHSRSDGIEEMCEVLELGWVFRKALQKSDMLELDIDDVRIAQIAKIFRLVDLVENFPLSGEEQTFRRRDLRRGALHAQTSLTQTGYSTRLWWNDPCKGGMTETFHFTPDGKEMEIDVYIWRETGRECRLRTVWKRV